MKTLKMKTAKTQIVSFHCVLRNQVGEFISSTFNSEVLNDGTDKGPLLQGLAEGLKNLKKGEKRCIHLSANRAYGFYDPELVIKVSRKKLAQGGDLQAGQQIVAQAHDGEVKVFRITQVTPRSVTLDANHPLAGQDLVFDIEATEAREATSEEIGSAKLRTSAKILH